MTREEKAIIYFKNMRKRLCEDHLKICPKDSIAYKATLAEKDFYDTAINALEQQSCDDAISREAVIELCEGWWLGHTKEDDFVTEVRALPSVAPQQRTGRWIEVIDEIDSLGNKAWHHECSICGSDKSGWGTYKYCPDCGTKMEVEE